MRDIVISMRIDGELPFAERRLSEWLMLEREDARREDWTFDEEDARLAFAQNAAAWIISEAH